MVALTVGISVGVIVFTTDAGASHPVAYAIGEVVIVTAWLLTIARLRRTPQ